MADQIKPDINPSSGDPIEALAQQVLASIPPELTKPIQDVVIRVVDFPDPETRRHLKVRSRYGLLGLYHGTSILGKSVMYPQPNADMIYLFRQPILEYCRETGETLDAVVRNVLIHEIGHHFGFSDADMERLERES